MPYNIHMTKKTTLTFTVDKDVKELAQKKAKTIGIPVSTLLNMYLKEFSATGHIEFDANKIDQTFDPATLPSIKMTKKTERLIAQAEKEIANDEVSPSLDNAKDAIEWLRENAEKY